MKKVLSIAALAAIVLGFYSCKPKPEPEPAADFKITVDNISQFGANVKIEPLDTVATYYCNLFLAADVKALSNEELATYLKNGIDEDIKNYKSKGTTLTYADFLQKGEFSHKFENQLPPRTEFCVVAVKMDDQGVIDANSACKKDFKTLEVAAKATKSLDFHQAVLLDVTSRAGMFQVHAAPADSTSEVLLTMVADEATGHFSILDCYMSLSGFYDGETRDLYGFLDMDFTGTAADSKITYAGWFIADNETKYNFSFECATSANAPANIRSLKPAQEFTAQKAKKSFGYIIK